MKELLNDKHTEANEYHIYPTIIDSNLQLINIASTNEEVPKNKLRLSVSCDELSVFRCSSNFIVGVTTKFTDGSVVAEARGVVDEITVLSMSKLKLAAVNNFDSIEAHNTHAAARQKLVPDIDFIDVKELIRPSIDRSLYKPSLETLSHLCLIHSQRCLTRSITERPHLRRFRQWIDNRLNSLNVSSFNDLSNETIFDRINGLVCELRETPEYSAATALQKVCDNISIKFSYYDFS